MDDNKKGPVRIHVESSAARSPPTQQVVLLAQKCLSHVAFCFYLHFRARCAVALHHDRGRDRAQQRALTSHIHISQVTHQMRLQHCMGQKRHDRMIPRWRRRKVLIKTYYEKEFPSNRLLNEISVSHMKNVMVGSTGEVGVSPCHWV